MEIEYTSFSLLNSVLSMSAIRENELKTGCFIILISIELS